VASGIIRNILIFFATSSLDKGFIARQGLIRKYAVHLA
jgi:hypothetical protein